jgi:hypothetical protein
MKHRAVSIAVLAIGCGGSAATPPGGGPASSGAPPIPDASWGGAGGSRTNDASRIAPEGGPSSEDAAIADAGVASDAAETGTPPGPGRLGTLKFTRKTLHTFNYAEAIAFGDYNKDGKVDVLSGPFWWEGPSFDTRHQLFPPPPNNSYTGFTLGDWADYAYDIDGDGWTDSINVMRPGTPSYWYKNPGMPTVTSAISTWAKSEIGTLIWEQSALADMTGDGRPELVGAIPGQLGFFDVGTRSPWTFHAISPPDPRSQTWPWFHGLGSGDILGDGKVDLLEANGWWSPPAGGPTAGLWLQHRVAFKAAGLPAEGGGSQMFAYDVNGDGQMDVVTALNAHGYGVGWFEQDKGSFTQHVIVGQPGDMNAGGIPSFSQPHALFLTDVDGDGLKDVITGKSFYAHAPGVGTDPDVTGTPVFYVFKLVRDARGVSWEPHLVDSEVGLGRQLTATDLNGDGLVDIAVASKHGVFLFFQQ